MNKIVYKMRNYTAGFIVVLLSIVYVLPTNTQVYANQTITISTADDMAELANQCKLNTFSKNLIVILSNDIDISNREDALIPSFSGTFDGAGHTISGVTYSGATSPVGLFGILQEGGQIKNLNISGKITPTNNTNNVGGLVGINYGSIFNCSFTGQITGNENVGGLVGINKLTGTINNSIYNGAVFGISKTAGIAGCNEGAVNKCINYGQINSVGTDPSLSIEEIDLNLSTNLFRLASLDTLNVAVDSGGIAGCSSGILIGCTNNGTVGYSHTGYNVGGVVGRSSGFMSNCHNTGSISGRKNVGGVAGFLEPYTILNLSPDKLTQLRTEINALSALIDTTITDTEGSASTINSRLTKLFNSVNDISSSAEDLSTEVGNYYNGIISEIDRGSLIVDDAISMFNNITDGLPSVSTHLTNGISNVSNAIDSLDGATTDVSAALVELKLAVSALQTGISEINYGTEQINLGLKFLDSSIEINDPKAVDKALNNIADGVSLLTNSIATLSDSLLTLSQRINNNEWTNDFTDELNRINNCITKLDTELTNISDSLQIINDNLDINWDSADRPWEAIQIHDSEALDKAFESIYEATAAIIDIAKEANSTLSDINKTINDAITWGKSIGEALSQVTNAFSRVSNAVSYIDGNIQYLRNNISSTTAYIEPALKLIEQGVNDFSDSMLLLNDALSFFNTTIEKLNDSSADISSSLKELKKASNEFREASDEMTDVFSGLENLVNYLNGVDPIQISTITPDIDNKVEKLYDSGKEITKQAELLNSEAKNASDTLLEDLRQINEQINTVSNIIIDLVFEVTEASPSDIHNDTSESNIYNTTSGRIWSCSNSGYIYGDIDIGGIAGSMAIYNSNDPEGDTELSLSSLFRKRYEMKCIIHRCTNTGRIVSKRSNVGGICGEIELGLIMGCENYGYIQSESGSCVGGVAGKSNSTIRNSFAKCMLEGTGYVGGILGCASLDKNSETNSAVLDCISMVEIYNCDKFFGAITGLDAGQLEKNYFVSDTLAGIDRISYTGIAEPVTYEELIKTPFIPSAFKHLTLSYMVNDTVISTVIVSYGDSTDKSIEPNIPPVNGCYSYWENTNYDNLHFDKLINAVYDKYTTAIASKEKRDNGLSTVIVKGLFDDMATVSVRNSSTAFPGDIEPEDKIIIDFSNDGLSSHSIRYLPKPSPLKKIILYVNENGEWNERSFSEFGSYLEFEASGNCVELAVIRQASRTFYIIAGAICSIIIVGLIVLLHVLLARHKRSKLSQVS